MPGIVQFILGLEGLFFFVGLVIIIVLIVRRVEKKKKENFEDRSN